MTLCKGSVTRFLTFSMIIQAISIFSTWKFSNIWNGANRIIRLPGEDDLKKEVKNLVTLSLYPMVIPNQPSLHRPIFLTNLKSRSIPRNCKCMCMADRRLFNLLNGFLNFYPIFKQRMGGGGRQEQKLTWNWNDKCGRHAFPTRNLIFDGKFYLILY